MAELVKEIAAWVTAVLAASGVLTLFAFWLFKLLGEKWLTNKFAQRLEAFKHDQQREIEHLRFEISRLLDRAVKLHQREFDVLPRAWSLTSKAFHGVEGVAASLQSYPDLQRMGAKQLDEFIAKCPLAEWQKQELKDSADKNKYYQKHISWYYVGLARTAVRKSAVYLLRNGIFMPPDVKAKFQTLHDMTWDAFVEHELNLRHEPERAHQNYDTILKFAKDGKKLMTELETEVHKRLWNQSPPVG